MDLPLCDPKRGTKIEFRLAATLNCYRFTTKVTAPATVYSNSPSARRISQSIFSSQKLNTGNGSSTLWPETRDQDWVSVGRNVKLLSLHNQSNRPCNSLFELAFSSKNKPIYFLQAIDQKRNKWFIDYNSDWYTIMIAKKAACRTPHLLIRAIETTGIQISICSRSSSWMILELSCFENRT